MKKFIFGFLILVFMFSACSSAETAVEITSTATVSPTVTYTSTPNITPLPTIPTFTPTFDVSTIVTVTPAKKTQCPIPNELLEIELPQLNNLSPKSLEPWLVLDQKILYFLNQGGQVQKLTLSYKQNDALNYYGGFLPMSLDLTGDFVDEIIVFNPVNNATKISPAIFIFGCKNGKYYNLFTLQQPESSERFQNIIIKDMNANNIPEVVFQLSHVYPEFVSRTWVYEFQNGSFESLLSIPYDGANHHLFFENFSSHSEEITYKDYIISFGENNFVIENIDKNPFEELILEWDINFSDGPSRLVKIIYLWDGNKFSSPQVLYSKPEYLFQAIQDADSNSIHGYYPEAFFLYQEAIHNEQLIFLYFDYSRLASYAHYRIMLLQLIQGQADEANKTYQTLLNTFGNDIYAKPYIEMATTFLEAYNINQKMYDGCAAAIQYAVEHPEILIPLGSDYHGSQAKIYKPEDICPFR